MVFAQGSSKQDCTLPYVACAPPWLIIGSRHAQTCPQNRQVQATAFREHAQIRRAVYVARSAPRNSLKHPSSPNVRCGGRLRYYERIRTRPAVMHNIASNEKPPAVRASTALDVTFTRPPFPSLAPRAPPSDNRVPSSSRARSRVFSHSPRAPPGQGRRPDETPQSPDSHRL